MIAGLEPITKGDLAIGGHRVNDADPFERGVANAARSMIFLASGERLRPGH